MIFWYSQMLNKKKYNVDLYLLNYFCSNQVSGQFEVIIRE